MKRNIFLLFLPSKILVKLLMKAEIKSENRISIEGRAPTMSTWSFKVIQFWVYAWTWPLALVDLVLFPLLFWAIPEEVDILDRIEWEIISLRKNDSQTNIENI